MSANEARVRNALNAFGSILRQSALAEVTDVQQVLITLEHLLSRTPADDTLDLRPLRDLLLESRVPDEAITEAFIVLQYRQSQHGITLVLPPHLENLNEVKRQKLIDAWVTRGGGTPRSQESLKHQRAPGPQAPIKNPKAQRSQTGRLIGTLLFLLVAGGGTLVYQQSTRPARAERVNVSDPGALSCDELKVNGAVAVCSLSDDLWQYNQKPSMKQRAEKTKQSLAPRPVTSVLIIVDGNIKARF